jgi:hypothetical protein
VSFVINLWLISGDVAMDFVALSDGPDCGGGEETGASAYFNVC